MLKIMSKEQRPRVCPSDPAVWGQAASFCMKAPPNFQDLGLGHLQEGLLRPIDKRFAVAVRPGTTAEI
jgi:hypothetical protein